MLIAHLRGVEDARGWLEQARTTTGRLAVSVVSVAEITGGMRSGARSDVARLLASLQVQAVTEEVGQRAGELMRRHRRSNVGIGLADYLIAATADLGGHDLATLNVRHFPMFRGLRPPFRLPTEP